MCKLTTGAASLKLGEGKVQSLIKGAQREVLGYSLKIDSVKIRHVETWSSGVIYARLKTEK